MLLILLVIFGIMLMLWLSSTGMSIATVLDATHTVPNPLCAGTPCPAILCSGTPTCCCGVGRIDEELIYLIEERIL
eukprot:7740219-Ditylum_brightwellii.AAC.1